MTHLQADIRYLFHSGFSLETASKYLVFDYWENNRDPKKLRSVHEGILRPDLFPKDKQVLVFASHNHRDHFDPRTLDWAKEHPNIQYIFSSDINVKNKELRSHFMSPYETWTINDLIVKTYGSTDQGVSFLVQTDGLDIFHAGDLNMWYWYYESTPEELIEDRKKFIGEMDKMNKEHVDIAFFPVDPRLKEYGYLGGKYFINQMKPDLFIPMHFGEDYGFIKAFERKFNSLPSKIIPIEGKGQKIVFNKPFKYYI
ncbi:MAG TPA: hydrolase [Clostridiales bacterium]|nr:hydrolase [Clostridiales bacterium]